MIGRKAGIVAIVSLAIVVGAVYGFGAGDRSGGVPLKGKWPREPFNPTAIFDDSFELSVKDGRIHMRCGKLLDGEVRRIVYDKASDLLTLEDIATKDGKDTPIYNSKVVVVVHPNRSTIPKSFAP